jgi:hypothetical protein
VPASLEELAYDLSRSAIEQQEKRQAELRSRAATMLAAASIAGSFLAGQAVKAGTLDGFGVCAVLSYLGCVASSLYVLLPHQLVLEFRGSVALQLALDARADLAATFRAVAVDG